MNEEMNAIINAPEKHICVQAFAGCFPRDTMYFNGVEWKNIQDYQDGEYVLQFNPKERKGELVKPLKYIHRKHSSGWYKITFETKGSIICSGDHDILYYDNNYNYHYCNVKDLKKGVKILTPTNAYVGITNTVFRTVDTVEKINLENDEEYCFEVPSGNLILRQRYLTFCISNCGKSTTMLEYVKAHPNEKILFLVYNKEMAKDFSNRLKGVAHNCEVRTIHSLAYRWYLAQGFPKKNLRNITIIDIQDILKSRLELSELSKIKFYFEMFLTSDVDEAKQLHVLEPQDKYLLKFVEKVWKYYITESDSMPHNVYLKMFQLAKVKLDYDTIINDETNDINQCMLSILVSNLDKKVICVGDSYQMINSFNFNCDGLNILKNDYNFKQYGLTKSFRVSEDIANMSSKYLSFMYENKTKFNGLGHTKIAHINLYSANQQDKVYLLCRTRLGGLKQIVDVLNHDISKRIHFVGGLEAFGINEIERMLQYNGNIYIGGKRFHINTLRKMLKDGVEDNEIQRIVSVYDFAKKNENILDILKQSEVKDKTHADIVLLTSHSSKGLTLTNVVLGNDFPPIEKTKIKMHLKQHEYKQRLSNSEANLLYVALTRATGVVDIGQCFNREDKIDKSKKLDEVLDY